MKGDFIARGDVVMRRTDVIARARVMDIDFALPDFFQVRATQQGFIHWLRNPGDVFMIPRHLYSPTWMQIMDQDLATIVEGDRRLSAPERSIGQTRQIGHD